MSEYRKKLIEVALPLEAINKESAREKSIRHGHPSTLHLWWSRKPLATSRAVLFAQIVDDPSSLPEEFPTEEAQETERQRLFRIIEELVKWDNTTNEAVLHAARVEIARSAARNQGVSLPRNMAPAEVAAALKQYAPPTSDPFAGGGSIPLEAQRLGLEAHASDLNPVAVLINKALIEIPPKFAGRPPVHPAASASLLQREWHGAQGLAEDVRHYGKWMRTEAEKRIGHLYPKVTLPREYGGEEATVIAWLWARTITCPNPACGAQMPLISKWWLSNKKGKEVWVEPIVNYTARTIQFKVQASGYSADVFKEVGTGTSFMGAQGKKTKATFKCITCGVGVVKGDYIDSEANDGKMSIMPLAVVAEGKHGRAYLSIDNLQIDALLEGSRLYLTQPEIHEKMPLEPARGTFASNAQGRIYGFKTFADYFTSRQLAVLITFCQLVHEVKDKILADASAADGNSNRTSSDESETDITAYADAIVTYLALALDRLADRNSTLCSWDTGYVKVRNTFARQAISMTWDFAEANPFSDSTGNFLGAVDWVVEVVESSPCSIHGDAVKRDAMALDKSLAGSLISTDPPYYDNVGYADLADFFYVWLRRSLSDIYPGLFSTILIPKAQELVATHYRFEGDKKKAQQFFETGLGKAFEGMRAIQHPQYPLTIYYAFKQSESDTKDDEIDNTISAIASTGWETMLEGLIRSGFSITGTWPIRTEMANRNTGQGTNVLASSIVLVCRPRRADAPFTTRRDFLNVLKRELPNALKDLQRGNIAPVDLAQAAIGPGMAVFSRYSKVLESDGASMRVRTALQLINQMLDEVLAEQEGEYDSDTRWAVAWFEQYSMEEGPYGVAETLSKAKNTALGALVESGILRAQGGKVRLLSREEFSSNWHPATAKRITAWEVTQRLIRALQEHGDAGAASILEHVGAYGEIARDLAYRLYMICERKKWADEALAYNSLVVEWSDISGVVEQLRRTTAEQAPLFS